MLIASQIDFSNAIPTESFDGVMFANSISMCLTPNHLDVWYHTKLKPIYFGFQKKIFKENDTFLWYQSAQ